MRVRCAEVFGTALLIFSSLLLGRDMEEKLYTSQEVAQLLRLSPRTISLWCSQGKIKHHKLGDKRNSLIRIPESEVEKLLSESERANKNAAVVAAA